MEKELIIRQVEERVNNMIQSNPAHFLVEVRIKPTNNIKVFIDSDQGVQLSDLVSYNRRLYRELEESGIFPNDDFSLEVSSPGLDEPLKLHRQYNKNVGRYVEVTLNDGKKMEGKLTDSTEDGIVVEIEEGKGKKKTVRQETVLFENIRQTRIQIKF